MPYNKKGFSSIVQTIPGIWNRFKAFLEKGVKDRFGGSIKGAKRPWRTTGRAEEKTTVRG